jgi:hypothetical protein
MTIRVLHYVLGVVVFIQSAMTAVNSSEVAHQSHIPFPAHFVLVIGTVEAIAAVLFLLPWTLRIGGWILLAVFAVAVIVHVLHGQFEGTGLLIYAAAVLAVMYGGRGDE